ncbi:hypothetical protein HS088_TW20G00730 [Tripterygium wilfordii]|uniref:Uncharacterized protein n=1 Tax=Tripterygium wilfordii TaxID=458696 RepID=A0A7J7C928_TRIWF|nr:uncharacterized protein LOC119986721 [Tripterygium wilfordii]XP_038687323.1 uncharacterized protein LOC119986721 [Tripterygium wilfordii]KAF5730357.1 hypothetical protein HS088_TW20G00730 [Tripterygium wilfordii]
MALSITATTSTSRAEILHSNPTKQSYAGFPVCRYVILPLSHRTGPPLHIVSAKKFSSRTERFDRKNRGLTTTTDKEDRTAADSETFEAESGIDDGFVMPQLPGKEPDFWEGPQWDGLGFFVQYMWAFGILFSIIACGIAVATYNEGATDFKETPSYKESIQSQELLEEPDASSSDVFESNPTEVAPSLE